MKIDQGRNLFITELESRPMFEQDLEFVERKGLGHPDSICDAVSEEGSIALCKEYLSQFEMILHHNLDKGLLIAGTVDHRFGGGGVVEPMRLIVGDRATFEFEKKQIPVDEIVRGTVEKWFRNNLRFVDVESNLKIEIELKPGSPELIGIFARGKKGLLPANDTSATVGYAPLTPTEHMVLNVENYLSSTMLRNLFPSIGDDIKIMGYRKGKSLQLTIAVPLVDMFIDSTETYFVEKRKIIDHLSERVNESVNSNNGEKTGSLKDITVSLNALDEPDRGIDGIYTTVTGTSAEDADSGEVGRGNRVNGLIAFNRPISIEAAAGKNPVSHVGKIYTVLSHKIAAEIYSSVEGIAEAYVWLCSRIGEPIDNPKVVSVQLGLDQKLDINAARSRVQEIVNFEFANIKTFVEELSTGTYRVV